VELICVHKASIGVIKPGVLDDRDVVFGLGGVYESCSFPRHTKPNQEDKWGKLDKTKSAFARIHAENIQTSSRARRRLLQDHDHYQVRNVDLVDVPAQIL
jgi:hypothetical protein